jgi:hypothetical protein
VPIVRGDVLDYQSLQRAASNCQLIFHLAARTEASRTVQKSPRRSQYSGTANVAREHFLVGAVGSFWQRSAHGHAIKNRSITEDTIPIPIPGQSAFSAERPLVHHQRDGLSGAGTDICRTWPGAMSWLNLFKTLLPAGSA